MTSHGDIAEPKTPAAAAEATRARAFAALKTLPPRLADVVFDWAERTPDATALVEGDRRLTYGEAAAAIRDTARWLTDQGLRPGDRLMVVNENGIALALLLLAAGTIDVWLATINARLSEGELETIRAHSGARRVIYTVEVSPDAAQHAAHAGIAEIDVPHLGRIAIGPLNETTLPEPVDPTGEQVAALIYTSGTTGKPKGVMLTHRNLLSVGSLSAATRQMRPQDVVYAVLPMSHVYGLSSVFLCSLTSGASLEFMPRFSARKVLEDLQSGRITCFLGVPAMYARFIELLGTEARLSIPALRVLSSGGSPLDPVVKARTEALFGLPVLNGYGLTEASPTLTGMIWGTRRADVSVGPALPGVELRLVGPDGKDAPEGGIGELWARGPGIMKGYYHAPDLTAQVLSPDGWLNTGDFARIEPDGAVFIVGRSKELIIRSGFNVYPVEVEAVLNAFPGITQSAVVGRPAEAGNEEVVAFLEPAPEVALDLDALKAHVAANLAPYKHPSDYVVMQALPAGATGKILKNRLAAMARGDT
ncbi:MULTISPECIES: class I adenylate-forming enzyme family protein [unclassified Haematobacter]|uniref:class I adenylate-forming enzyme family protein n=1 Tax=unclassified Haematobacter TaxID=2640585 RepID=UPI0025C1D085|nr:MULTISPECIES: AMP-binding protein [unclassified Haematobacter]